ncbi:MAG: efflux RND transporter permease subunit [Bacteroidales bacterium]|nr:efflux RND transporter permease subunit [Bacteroidales bacterium]
MKRSTFTLLLTLAILMVIGCALIPRIEVADNPRPRQGKTLSIRYFWNGASAKVVEQNVTSRIEGLVSAVRGVETVTSESYFGSGGINVVLKKNANVSATKFEIASLLRQVREQLPEGVSYPELLGGEVINENRRKESTQVLLNYRVNSNLSDEQLKEYIERQLEPLMRQIEEVKRVEVTGARSKYIVITYDPFILSSYGLSVYDIENGIKAFLGKCDIVGEIKDTEKDEKRTLFLTTEKFHGTLERIPVGNVAGKTVYLNDLAAYEYKDRLPNSYYRVNGMNTIYMNIHVDAEANKIMLSKNLRKQIAKIEKGMRQGVYLTLTYDGAKETESELYKLVWRSMLSLIILLAFVWLIRRDWRYLTIMVITLFANLAISVIAYYIFDIRLHIYSLAGITVSLGMVIDASVVMVDHYSYYYNRKAFMAILAALLTTIGSLIVVLWLPDFLKKDLYDFAWIIIINLSIALVVAYFFAPAMIEQMNYHSRQKGKIERMKLANKWNKMYGHYIRFTQKRKWIYFIILVIAFGIPFHALPSKWGNMETDYMHQISDTIPLPWYAKIYNDTFGSDLFQQDYKVPLSKMFGGTMRLFSESLSENTYNRNQKKDIKLIIRAQMPLGGTASQLNEKVVILENLLTSFPEIERFETRIAGWGATVTVEFKEEYKNTSFPFILENKVIGKVISIGGADWSTSGVSERGFSNSLNLQQRLCRIEIVGYNYDHLYRIAEDLCDDMRKNNRVIDLVIETPGHEYQEDELYMHYENEKIALYNFDINKAHSTLREILSGREIDRYRDTHFTSDMYLKSAWQDKFDLWRMDNSILRIGDKDNRISDFMSIDKREAKNCIPRQNQEYVLRVAFNVLGNYTYTDMYIRKMISDFNDKIPVGYRCRNTSYGFYQDNGTQYWLLGLIIVIIFFVCSILFESLRQPLAIISLIPVSFIGTFLVYSQTGLKFGSGGFASMVLLCGLTVNAAIYIICEYNNQRDSYPSISPMKCYLRAYNHKVTAVFLTTLSTILGLVPFFIDSAMDSFWFSFAVGSSVGLLFSIVALVFIMPLFVNLKNKRK